MLPLWCNISMLKLACSSKRCRQRSCRRVDLLCTCERSPLLFLQDSPPPNSYNVSKTFEKANSHSFSEPRSDEAKRRQSCFLSAAPRDSFLLHCEPGVPGISVCPACLSVRLSVLNISPCVQLRPFIIMQSN